nr:DNA-protecting protein DprA [Actinomycetota bacterium]
ADEWPSHVSEPGAHAPPERLFVAGVRLPHGVPAVAVVGTRRPTAAGIDRARAIAGTLAQAGFVIISGLAVGIDAAAHAAALEAGGITVAVLGCGLDVDYPAANRRLKQQIARTGTVVSEYPPGVGPLKRHFPARNRIIAGLSVGVVVVEGAETSGALVTARLALDLNRSVYAVPGSTRNPMAAGPNELIRTGRAALVSDPRHILEDLAPSFVWSPSPGSALKPAPVDRVERDVLAALEDTPTPLDRISAMIDATAGRAALSLATLEVRGLVTRGRGGYLLTDSGARALR